MKISYNWLKTLIPHELSVQELSDHLTAAGLEVEGTEAFESLPGGLQGLVVGEVIECVKHPDADRLSLTKVNIGKDQPLAIVCGAPNVAAGQKVIVATVGAKLFPTKGEPFEIKKSKIRGAASEGMICAEDEIGLGESHAGIMVLPEDTAVGMPAADYFKIERDTVLEIGLTPNRSDAASHLGVARDLTAILNSKDTQANYEVHVSGLHTLDEASGLNTVQIKIENNEGCPRYSGLVISGITVKESPDWLKNRLKSIGVRPINNIVDITNFVLHEMGQPLHAFDLEKIKGNKIIVRNAKEGEKFVTLDGVERSLKSDDLMICNAEAPMCIAGVFGGLESGVTENTKAIFLESAYFDPGHIRKSSKHHGLKTDASFRFERGTDPEMTVQALVRAANLVFDLAGGTLSMDTTDIYPSKLEPYKIGFSYANCRDLIGKDIDKQTIRNIIHHLGIGIENEGSDGMLLKVPRYKADVTREADVIEEVLRIYGYNNVEVSKSVSYGISGENKNNSLILDNRVSKVLEGFGFMEMMNLSLEKESNYDQAQGLVKVMNPLSNDLNVMRADMIYGGLTALAHNINRKNADLKLFEIGKTYHLKEGDKPEYTEKKHLTLFVSGDAYLQNSYGLNQKADFYFLKGAVNAVLEKCGVRTYKSAESTYAGFDFGLSYEVNGKVIVELGSVSRQLLKKYDIGQEVYYAFFNAELLAKLLAKQKIEFRELSKFPAVRRDLALLLDKAVKYKELEDLAFSTEKKLLKEVNLFDIYESEKLGNKKSYAMSFTLMNEDATLTDKQIDSVMEKLIKGYKEKLGAELR